MYINVWRKFAAFTGSEIFSLPIPVVQLANFIGQQYSTGLRPSTILSHVSAISYVHKILNIDDPTATFIIRKILKGCEKLAPSVDSRLPITKSILERMVVAIPSVIKLHFHQILLKAIFLVAFNGFFRLGELVVRTPHSISKVIQRRDVNFIFQNNAMMGVEIIIRHFKTNTHNKPFTIFMAGSKVPHALCPVHSLFNYLQLFKHQSGPLFQNINNSAVTAKFVTDNMSKILTFLGIDSSFYKGHSFRIGAATNAASLGHSEQIIQKLGRWNSNALQRYIRIDTFSV